MPTPRFRKIDRPRVVTLQSDVGTQDNSNGVSRPMVRDQCRYGTRPCPFVGCRYHLYLNYQDGRDRQSVVVNFPSLEPWEIPETCALDVADRGAASVEEIGFLLNLSKSGVEKIIDKTIATMHQCMHHDESQEI